MVGSNTAIRHTFYLILDTRKHSYFLIPKNGFFPDKIWDYLISELYFSQNYPFSDITEANRHFLIFSKKAEKKEIDQKI